MGKNFFVVCILACGFWTVLNAQADIAQKYILKAQELGVASNEQWQKLLHEGQPDGPRFYLSVDGKKNPGSELEATLKAFFLPDTQKQDFLALEKGSLTETEKKILTQHAQCRFPARLKFLKNVLAWDGHELPKISCELLESFRKRLDAQSVSMVFSSFYLNNPSSTFGHSFLRINSGLWNRPGVERNELLDAGVNYTADTTVGNPLLFAIFGMTGLLPGRFSVVPYYYKVREYNDYESRDLWSYDLNLTKEEIDLLIDHIWEEQSTYYDYFYFTENCSYHMFTLIDAIAPRYRLLDVLPKIVIPSNSIRVLYQVPGLVSRVTFRPSVRSQLKERVKNMSDQEINFLHSLIQAQDPTLIRDAALSSHQKAEILDAYSDQIELGHAKQLLINGSDTQKLKQKVLVERASLAVKSPDLKNEMPMTEAPHLGHGTRRLDIGWGSEVKPQPEQQIIHLGYKFAMKDLLDPGPGYPSNMQVDFGVLRGRYRVSSKKLEWDEINLFKLTTLSPIHPLFPSFTFRAEIGAQKWVDPECNYPDGHCLVPEVNGGAGWTLALDSQDKVLAYGFANAKFPYTRKFYGPNFRPSLGPKAGILFLLSEKFKAQIDGELDWRAFSRYQPYAFTLESSVRLALNTTWAFDFKILSERMRRESILSVMYYY